MDVDVGIPATGDGCIACRSGRCRPATRSRIAREVTERNERHPSKGLH